MSYEVKGEILGFQDTKKVDIKEIDTLFSTMIDEANENISFTLANPFVLRDYTIDIPLDAKDLLEIDENSQIGVYNILIIQKPLEKSTINFLAPIIINLDKKLLTQVILDPKKHPDYGMAETIESFK
ncbi:flagellar assembly protein FliW [Sulfurimonas paralvinellae]|uniref:Flagellar assembly factor FliW n=1 Tax=Sulfurimonas paralvinellae TaxID=317658 RepID=A0A7M1BAL5_9BACT|nr:flagellar assembly protein FliW [Sulfurimonas paralvinellae]QOP46661.1 flagellar assembly protein FliW [Sulfurimonas paralvinellae]